MDKKQLDELIVSGKKIPDKVWKSLTKEEKEYVKASRGPRENDWSWYAVSEQIAKDLGSIPYNVMAGVGFQQKINYVTDDGDKTSLFIGREREMCTMVLNVLETPGYADQRTSGVNMAATLLYTSVRRRNSGARNYEAADLMMYILAMKEVYAEIAEIKRAFGTAALYDMQNHYLPDMLLAAQGIDAQDLRNNIANYRGKFNFLIKKTNAMAVPNYFKIFDRESFIGLNVFADSTSIRGQFYIFRRSAYYYYSATASTTGTSLVYSDKGYADGVKTMAQRLTALEGMLDNLFLDDDVNTMSGDILKAFGSNQLYRIEEIDENYKVSILYDENILAQIENSVSLFASSGATQRTISGWVSSTLNITQANQLISFTPAVSVALTVDGPGYALPERFYFNSHKDDPDYKDNLEWSRLITLLNIDDYVAEGSQWNLKCFGLEIVTDYELYRYNSSGTITTTTLTTLNHFNGTVLDEPAAMRIFANILDCEQFDWHPMYYMTYVNSGTTLSSKAVGADLKKYTTVGVYEVKPLHESAVTATLWSVDLYEATGPKNE